MIIASQRWMTFAGPTAAVPLSGRREDGALQSYCSTSSCCTPQVIRQHPGEWDAPPPRRPSSAAGASAARHPRTSPQRVTTLWLVAALCLAGGCESVQRKFTPKHKKPQPIAPVVEFKAYAPTSSADELYRHHLLLWDFWNGELIGGFGVSEKKVQHASKETLAELLELQRFLPEPKARQLQRLVDEHRQLDARIQRGYLDDTVEQMLKRRFEFQQRAVRRDFSPRDVKDQLHLPDQNAPGPTPAATP